MRSVQREPLGLPLTSFPSVSSSGSFSPIEGPSETSSTISLLPDKRHDSNPRRHSIHGLLTIHSPRNSNLHRPYSLFPGPGPRHSLPAKGRRIRSFILLEPERHSHPHFFYKQASNSKDAEAKKHEAPYSKAIEHRENLWHPWALRTTTLAAILVFSLGCIAALEVLSLLSQREHGIRTWNWEARFIWTVGPHLLFVTTGSIWAQVEYRTKQIMPWRAMASGPVSPDHSVLLDYVTPLSVVSLLRSLRARHCAVTAAVTVSAIIKLLIIVSTAVLWLDNDRLITQEIPLRIMEGLLVSLAMFSCTMIFLHPAPATPNDTSTIAGLAAVLSTSPTFMHKMEDMAVVSKLALEEAVTDRSYETIVTYKANKPVFSISQSEGTKDGKTEAQMDRQLPKKWWVPIHDLTRLCVMSLIFGTGVLVELIHQRSQTNNGLFDHMEHDPRRYAWQMLPPSLGIMVSVLVGTIDHAARVIQPFCTLKEGNALASRSIEINYMSCLGPQAAFKAFRCQHWAVLCTASASIFAPLLTVASASLFFPEDGRLVQDTIPTRIVEVLLGIIFLLLLISTFALDVRNVLPYDPCSIARMSSLTAPLLCSIDTLPAGTEWVSKRDIAPQDIFRDYRYRLGFFEKPKTMHTAVKNFGIDAKRLSTGV